jgi:hypothetical protein
MGGRGDLRAHGAAPDRARRAGRGHGLCLVNALSPNGARFKKFGLFAACGRRWLQGSGHLPPNLITKRTDAIRKGLPDALDLLVICAEAGLTVDAAFNRVAKELGRAYPELGDEFALTSIELSFLQERRQAFENLAYRVKLDSVKGVVTTMIQTERYGTPLASALRVLSAEFRNERMMRAEEKAARLPAIMTVPLILFILPVLFVVILGPAACSIPRRCAGPSPSGRAAARRSGSGGPSRYRSWRPASALAAASRFFSSRPRRAASAASPMALARFLCWLSAPAGTPPRCRSACG